MSRVSQSSSVGVVEPDRRMYDDIQLYRANGRLILSIGGFEYVLNNEQEKQFREQLREVKLAPAKSFLNPE